MAYGFTYRVFVWSALALGAGALIVGGHSLILLLERAVDLQRLAAEAMLDHPLIWALLLAYVILLAIPFVPGAELGFLLLLVFGADIALIVYGATVLGMTLAYLVGRTVPRKALVRGARVIGLRHLARALEASIDGNLSTIGSAWAQKWASRLSRNRLVALGLVINLPGNTVLGGGGGIAMAAGLSRLYAPRAFLATVLIAVSPVPIFFAISGM